ncbi:MAG TPA: hypothetical protein VE596_11300 [Gaiellaceae bacterium]|jgi:hypothetical protein|nr:hypothetical protein [Gaiellaceae bacterium]
MNDAEIPEWLGGIVAGARNPHNWHSSAEELKRASDLLRSTWFAEVLSQHERFQAYMAGELARPWEPWVGGPAMTLAAFAIENVLKGLLIASNPALVQPSMDQPEILFGAAIRSHNLLRLADDAGVDLSHEEKTLLERLTEFAQWAGRYRFPVRARDAAPRPGAEGGGSSFTSDWFPTLDAFFTRLLDDLEDAGRQLDRQRELSALSE